MESEEEREERGGVVISSVLRRSRLDRNRILTAETSKSARGRHQRPTKSRERKRTEGEVKVEEKQNRMRMRMTRKRRRTDEKKAAAPRVTTFERPTRRYTSRSVRVYQASPSANRAAETWRSSSSSTLPSSRRSILEEKRNLSFHSSQLADIDIDRNVATRRFLEIKTVDWLISSERYI